MPTYQEVIPANGKKRWLGGLSFLLMEVTGKVNIQFYGLNNKPIEKIDNVLEGVEGYWPGGFAFVEVEDISGAANTIQVMISNLAEWKYSRFKGDVSIDGNLAGIDNPVNIGTFANQIGVSNFPADLKSRPEFMDLKSDVVDTKLYTFSDYTTDVSGQYGTFQLLNPTGSNRYIFLKRIDAFSRANDGTDYFVRTYVVGAALSGLTSKYPRSSIYGAPSSRVCVGQTASLYNADGTYNMFSGQLPGNSHHNIVTDFDWVIYPGYSLVGQANTGNRKFGMSFIFYEISGGDFAR